MDGREILVGVDGSAESDAAVVWAVTEAAARGCGVHIVHCCESRYFGLWTTAKTLREGMRAMARPLVEDALAIARRVDPQVPARGSVLVASPARALVRLSTRASLVVVGRSGRGAISHLLLGSAARHVLAGADCPVVSVGRGTEDGTTSRVVAAVDQSASQERTLDFAFGEARLHRVPLRVVTAAPHTQASGAALRELATALLPWQEQFPTVAVTTAVLVGSLTDTLAALCTPSDLLVLGHHRDGSLVPDLLGPRITSAMHAVRCRIAVVHEPITIQGCEPTAATVATVRGLAPGSLEPALLNTEIRTDPDRT